MYASRFPDQFPTRKRSEPPGTRRVLFTVYAVPGIGGEAVRQHLQTIQSYVRLIAPESVTELFEVVGSG